MSNSHRGWLHKYRAWLFIATAMFALVYPPLVTRAAESDGFNVQVAPSPLAVTLNPGERHTATITVRNLSSHSETLAPHLNGFTMSDDGDKIDLRPEVPLGLDSWITFRQSTLTIGPGASQPLEIIYNTPRDVGFSYAIAITLNQTDTKTAISGATLKGSVAVFNLININRADAKRELSIQSFTSSKKTYQYLPARFSVAIKNSGNVIDQPKGSIFIQRSFDDKSPIATIPLNASNKYLLPGMTRELSAEWNDGFPHYSTDAASGKAKLSWQWNKLGSLRMGKYIAKVVMVYNDGQRDVPLIQTTSFWIIPWKLIFGTLVIAGLVITGLVAWIRLAVKGTSRVRKYAHHK